ncbi:radical SAM protein [Candidatus Pacearchaeota archaeon]|nr:radical SAM protein [Candidatus Pacearchaeota archaeon]
MKENVYNISKLTFHKDKILSLAKGEISAPIYVRVKPTNRCNHACYYCSYIPDNDCPVSETMNFTDEIPKEKMFEILQDFKDMGVKAITYSGGGEPLIHPDITEIMQKTLDLGIDLSIITNGQELKGKKAEVLKNAKWVRISCGEMDAETFKKTRRRPESWFYELENNIKEFAKNKSPECEFGINFVVQNENASKVYESVKFFKDLGVNHIKITPCWMPDFLNYHKPIKESVIEQVERARKEFQAQDFTVYDTYKNDFELTGLDERKYSKCFVMQTIPVIGADSVVYFCHDKTYTNNGVLGSIKNRSFKDLWFSEEAAEIFKRFNPSISCKHHCTYDSRNILTQEMINHIEEIEKYLPQDEKHKNFI